MPWPKSGAAGGGGSVAVIRYKALTALREAIESAVPALYGKTEITWAPPEKNACMPAMALIAARWAYRPNQEIAVIEPEVGTTAVYDVGRHEATVQLRLLAATPGERMELEQQVIDLFLSQEGRPGILLTTIVDTPEIGQWFASWELEADEWRSEKAFSNKHWSVVEVLGTLPALVSRAGVYTIQDLRLGVTHDMTTTFTPTTFDASEGIERVRVNENGTLTPL